MVFNKENIMKAINECIQKMNELDDNEMQQLIALLRIDDYSQYEEILNYIFYNYPVEYTTDKVSDDPEHYFIMTRMNVEIDGRKIVMSLGTIPEKYYKYYTDSITNSKDGSSIIDEVYKGQKNNTMILTIYSQFEYKFSKEE